MGKAHTCVLMKNGEVWTFGVNNKGQCGRDTGAMNQGGKGKCLVCEYKVLCSLFNSFPEHYGKESNFATKVTFDFILISYENY